MSLPIERSQRRARFAILTMAWMIGGGLLAAPPEIGDAVRGLFRDVLAPGQTCVGDVTRTAREKLATWRCGADADQLASLRAERDRWRARYLELQARSADPGHNQDLAAAPPGTSTEPLIVPDLVEARILGSERASLRNRLSRLLDRGRSAGVTVDDLVLADSLPLLDLGADAQIERDMSVLAGGYVLGRIRQCGHWTSTVQPSTDPDFRAFVQIIRFSQGGPVAGAEGVLAGNGDGTCRMELVDAVQPVSIGDHVYGRLTDSLATPPCYGRITATELADGAANWVITVTPGTAIDDQQTVQVLREIPNPARMSGLVQDAN